MRLTAKYVQKEQAEIKIFPVTAQMDSTNSKLSKKTVVNVSINALNVLENLIIVLVHILLYYKKFINLFLFKKNAETKILEPNLHSAIANQLIFQPLTNHANIAPTTVKPVKMKTINAKPAKLENIGL